MLAVAPPSDPSGGGGKKPYRRGFKPIQDQHISYKKTLKSDISGAGGDDGLPESIKHLSDGRYSCLVCKEFNLKSINDVNIHCSKEQHKTLLLLDKVNKTKLVHRLRIESSGSFDEKKKEHVTAVRLTQEGSTAASMIFTITNVSANTVFKFLDWGSPYSRDEFHYEKPQELDIRLHPNEQLKLSLQMVSKQEFVHTFKIFFHFHDLNRQKNDVEYCNVKISFVSDLVADISSTGSYYNSLKQKPFRRSRARGIIVPGVPVAGLGDRDALEKDRPLPWFDMSKAMRRYINDGLVIKAGTAKEDEDELTLYKVALDESEVTYSNYLKRFSALLYMEEHQTDVDLELYFMAKVRLEKHGRSKLLSLEVPGLAENRPSVLRGDHLFVRKYLGPDDYDLHEYQGYVHEVQQTRVFLGFSQKLVSSFYPGMEFGVWFVNNRLPMRLQHRALSLREPDESDLENVLFPTEDTARTHGLLCSSSTEFRFYSRNPEPNQEQARAIRQIVQGTSRPAPYIVFGPPGTGKTFTIVEAIKQVLQHIPDARILACAPSNSAADLIAEKLLTHVQEREVYRLNAFCRPLSTIPEKIKKVCNLDTDNEVCYPSKSQLAKKGIRVYVTTLISAGRLVSARFAQDHFTHVFIDEASHATEPEALVALSGLIYMNNNMAAGKQIVLAGDPQQLGPILRSPYAKKLKLNMSLMERLMSCSLYRRRDQRGPNDGLYYDPMMITKLVRNYRSHPAILDVPNQLFYNEELVATGLPELTHQMCNWEHLPNKQMPVVFHAVIGEDMQEANSPSFFNPFEVSIVMKYLNWLVGEKSPTGVRIKEEHIGIITPYRKQVEKIRTELKKRKLENIKIGSVEEFQGQERLIIILSTVRSNPRFLTTDNKFGIGFLQDYKRFNVAVTRSKALLIVIGNPNILRHNPSWNMFVQYCMDNNCVIDKHLDRSDNDEMFLKLRQQLALLDLTDDQPPADELGPFDQDDISTFNNEQTPRRDQ